MSNYSSLVLSKNPSAYYRLGELSGPTAHDATSNHYDGVLSGAFTLLQQNAIITDYTDYAMLFTAVANGTSGGAITLPTTLTTNGLSTLTVEFWLMLTNNSFTYYPTVLDNSTTHTGFLFQIAPASDGHSGYFVLGNGAANITRGFGTSVLSAGVWYHLAGVYDGTQLIIYVNGLPDPATNTAMTGAIGTTARAIHVATNSAGTNTFLPATLDEIAIYPSALSANDILAHYTAGNFGRTGITWFPPAVRRQS